ncbi:hypothetical protein [Chitinophaga cymbidii]|uniref:Uncharacterized protein n=1 Tax=Chitinophaga cymbidii TaxID=1096750 RepID=A0A512RFK0_9BACT|nr:hypothetical protein [Chitinophaga cymbidii]GEP94480.1 hypothetical protein CCY01nite_07400 [Chitinophaga cymbidii]
MDNKKISAQLKQLEGKTFLYAGQIHFIQRCVLDEEQDKCTIQTNLNLFERKIEAVTAFLSYWEPFDRVNRMEHSQHPPTELQRIMESQLSVGDQLMQVLNESIEKVRKDKSYIPQAQAINNNVNTMVNIVKLRLGLWKQMKGSSHR